MAETSPTGALEVTATRLGRNGGRLSVLAGTMACALAALAALVGAIKVPALILLTITVVMVAALVGFVATQRRSRGTLRVVGKTLLWNGRPLFLAGTLREAIAYSNRARHGVRVRTRWRTAFFDLSSRAEADRVVAALGKDSSQAALSFGNEAVVVSSLWFSGWQALSGFHTAYRVLASLLLVIVLPYVVSRLTRQRWVVGSDGLLLTRGLRKGRFVPYGEIVSVKVTQATITVTLRDASRLTLKSRDDSRTTSWPVVGARALASRIDEARARAAVAAGERRDVAAELARGDRDVAAWITELSELEERPAGYRVASVPRDGLWAALEDVAQPPPIRAAAAVALRAKLRDGEKERLRVAAASCASPRLRVAFEAAEANDDARLHAALEDVVADDVPQRLRAT